MSVIRGERVTEKSVLSASGELLALREREGVAQLVEEECQKAFQRGEEHGEQIGYERAQEEHRTYLHLLQTLAAKLLDQKRRLLDQLKPELITLSMTVCERLIRRELSQNMRVLIHSLLKVVTSENDIVEIFLAPDDLAILEERIEGIRFHSDPLMRRGDCRIETKTRLLNYDISRELANLQSKVLC